MTYQEIFHMKHELGISTYELMQRFPRYARRVSEVALLDVPEGTLRELIPEERTLNRLIRLKRKLLGED